MTTFPNPVVIASLHQRHIVDLISQIRADAGCIRQLLVGRSVRRKSDDMEFVVSEARLGLANIVQLYGHRAGAKKTNRSRPVRIGIVADIEIAEVKP